MLLTGPALHLWFLPFAFVVCLVFYPLARFLMRSNRVVSLVLIWMLTVGAQALLSSNEFPTPFSQWAFVLPSAIFALAFVAGPSAIPSPTTIVLAVLAAGWFVVDCMILDWTTGLFQFGLAAGLLGLCLLFPLRETRLSRLAAEASLGVYLVHPLMISLLTRFTQLSPETLGLALSAMVGAVLFVLTLSLLKRQRKDTPISRSD